MYRSFLVVLAVLVRVEWPVALHVSLRIPPDDLRQAHDELVLHDRRFTARQRSWLGQRRNGGEIRDGAVLLDVAHVFE